MMVNTSKQYYEYQQINKQVLNQELEIYNKSQELYMKNAKKLEGKRNNIMICQQCKFFPILKQLRKCKLDQDLFQFSWTCQYCSALNICSADNQFRYFSNNGQLMVDESLQLKQDILFLIDITQSMHQTYYHLNNYNLNISGQVHQVRKNLQINKELLMEQSQLLSIYIQCQAIEERVKRGRYFSWDNFLKQKNLTKIEYSLWLVDYLRQRMKNIELKFFYQGNCKSGLSYGVLNRLFFKKLGIQENEIGKNVIKLQDIEGLASKIGEIVVISGSNIKQLRNKIKVELKIRIINIQQVIDPITLEATSTGQRIIKLLNANSPSGVSNEKIQREKEQEQKQKQKNTQIFDSRELDIPNFRQFANFIRQQLILQANNITIFQYRANKISNQSPIQLPGQNNKIQAANGWTKIMDKKISMDLLKKKYKQKNVTRVFNTLEKPKAELALGFSELINKIVNYQATFTNMMNTMNILSLIQEYIFNVNNDWGKNSHLRVSIELISVVSNKKYLILYPNSDYSSADCASATYYDTQDEQQCEYFELYRRQILKQVQQIESSQKQQSSISQSTNDNNIQFL